MRTRISVAALALIAVLGIGCATNFSPEMMRSEIQAQRGENPRAAFELSLGRFTTMMIQSALAGEDGELPFAGLTSLEVAVYEVESPAGPAIDVTRIAVRGWDPVIRAHNDSKSAMVLIRPSGAEIGDLVVVGAGPAKVIYARLRGALNPELPVELSRVLQDGGPDEIQRVLSELDG